MNPGNLSIRSRLFLLVTAVLLVWLLGGFIILSLIHGHTEYQRTALKIQSLPTNILRMKNSVMSFYMDDQASRRFQEEGASAALISFDASYLKNYGALRDLANLNVFQHKTMISQKVKTLQDYLSEADQLMETIVRKSRQRGWGEHGITGFISEQLAGEEIQAFQTIDPEFGEMISLLRLYTEAPTSSRLIRLQTLVADIKARLQNELAGTASGEDNPVLILLQQVDELLKTDRELGVSRFEGLHNQILRILGVLYEETEALSALSELEASHRLRGIRIGILITVMVTALLITAGLTTLGRSISRPLKDLKRFSDGLITGKFPQMPIPEGNSEFSEIARRMNRFASSLEEKAAFSEDLAEGEEGRQLTSLSRDDRFANALNKLETNLEAARHEELKHQHSREQRRWANEGIAKFGDILRIYNDDVNTLAEKVIQEIVIYLKASAGGFFIGKNEDTAHSFELVASFAFDRKKYLQRSYQPGEGLVGTCAIEGEKIFLTEIPEGYINIASGMGESDPRCLLLVPLKLEDQVLGVIELASLSVLEPFEIEFVDHLAGSIASAVATVKMNMRTAELLQQSQEQAREMSRQEEIMRQNMEVLQATQEESARRESEISGILNAIHNSTLVAEFNMEEELISMNDKFLQLLTAQRSQMLGKKFHEIVSVSRHTDDYKLLWQNIREGKTISRVDKITPLAGAQVWLRQTLTPIPDKDGQAFKVLNIATDITETIEQQESLEKQSAEIKRANIEMQSFSDAVDAALIKCIYASSGQILEVNSNYEEATGFTGKEQLGKNNRTFLQRAEKDQFERIWEDLMKNKPYSGVIRRTRPTGEETWLMSSFTPVQDEQGNVVKVIFLGQDITERKLKYQLLEEANKEIERLRKQMEDRN